MSYDDPATPARIVTSVSAQIAGELVKGLGPDTRIEDAVNDWITAFQMIEPVLQEAREAVEAAASVGQAFPGTVVEHNPAVPPPVAPVAVPAPAPQPAYVPPAQPAAQPAPIPGATDGDPNLDRIWRAFFADRSKFWDNRNNKRNPKAPDFKSKDNGDDAVWINDKKNPSWVPAALQAAGL